MRTDRELLTECVNQALSMPNIRSCENCKYWEIQKDVAWYKDMGRCRKLSAPKGEEYPNLDETGIESTPLCVHDGIGSEYETKKWFSCMHFHAL